jgi:hypothetical protein
MVVIYFRDLPYAKIKTCPFCGAKIKIIVEKT